MEILIIGGTQFVGRAVVERALARGHRVTLFHRGQTHPGLFAGRAEEILGDRKGDLSELAGRRWDAVIDVVGYHPEIVAAMCAAVQTERYAFISTISVYGDPTASEDSPTLPLPEGAATDIITNENYGPLKAQCEAAVTAAFTKSVIIRAGLQIGEYDHTDRFSDWVDRMLHRPRVAVPDDGMIWQFIDARDTADFTLHCLESDTYGTFNVTGEFRPMLEVLSEVRDAVAPAVELVPVSPAQVMEHAQPWSEMTLWVPEDQRSTAPFQVSIARAKAAGLTLRPLAETVQEIKSRLLTLDPARPRRGGLSEDKERAVVGH